MSLWIIARLLGRLLVALTGLAACIVSLVVLIEGDVSTAGIFVLGAWALGRWLDRTAAAIQKEIERR